MSIDGGERAERARQLLALRSPAPSLMPRLVWPSSGAPMRAMKLSSTVAVRRLDAHVCEAARRQKRLQLARDRRRRSPLARVGVVQHVAERIDRCARAAYSRSASSAGYRSRRGHGEQRPIERRAIAAGVSTASRRPLCIERDAIAAVGLVHVRRRDDDRQARRLRAARADPRTPGATPRRRRSSARRADRISGRCTSAQQSASFCFMPPESAAARRSLERLELVVDRRDLRSYSRVDRRAEHRREEAQVLLDAQIGIEREASGHVADAPPQRPHVA